MTTQNELARVQTPGYRLIINEAGAVLYTGTEDDEDNELEEKAELNFADLLAIADLVVAKRTEIETAKAQIEATWLEVADEVITRLEEQAPGLGTGATGEQIQRLLHDLGPVEFTRKGKALSSAGAWYQSMFTDDGYMTTFGLQWVAFLKVVHKRRMERFPDRYSPDGVLWEYLADVDGETIEE